jgi:hypothetical protein
MWPFVLGFCSGVVAVLLALLIAFFKLSSKIVRKPSRHHAVQRMQNQIAHKKSGEARSVPGAMRAPRERTRRLSSTSRRRAHTRSLLATRACARAAEYLEPYNEGVDSETCAWFDILLQRLFVDFSRAAVNVDVERYVNRRIASIRFPEFVVSAVAAVGRGPSRSPRRAGPRRCPAHQLWRLYANIPLHACAELARRAAIGERRRRLGAARLAAETCGAVD